MSRVAVSLSLSLSLSAVRKRGRSAVQGRSGGGADDGDRLRGDGLRRGSGGRSAGGRVGNSLLRLFPGNPALEDLNMLGLFLDEFQRHRPDLAIG